MSQPGDDAQRDLEQRALRNVRGLLDRMEDQERLDRKTTLKIAVICGVAAVVFLALVAAWWSQRENEPLATPVVLPAPAKTSR